MSLTHWFAPASAMDLTHFSGSDTLSKVNKKDGWLWNKYHHMNFEKSFRDVFSERGHNLMKVKISVEYGTQNNKPGGQKWY